MFLSLFLAIYRDLPRRTETVLPNGDDDSSMFITVNKFPLFNKESNFIQVSICVQLFSFF